MKASVSSSNDWRENTSHVFLKEFFQTNKFFQELDLNSLYFIVNMYIILGQKYYCKN